ncbi:MAG: hypothetical protein AAFR21_16615 [Pseudomonadota bacterium]
MKIKPENLPWLVVGYGIILALGGIALGVGAFVNPSTAVNYIEGADAIALGWAGRTLGLGLAMCLAIYLRSAAVYAVAFAGAIGRELGDLIATINVDGGATMIVVVGVLLALDAICCAISLRAALAPSN